MFINSERGLSSVTTLIVGAKENVMVDPPFLLADAEAVVQWVKSISTNPLKAVFVTHHHPDHFFSANPILEAHPEAKFYAAPVEEIESAALLEAWNKTLDLIESLGATTLIPGHIEKGWTVDAQADIAHMRKYLQLFGEKITYAKTKPQVKDLYDTFKSAFPQCTANLDFFLHHLSNQYGEGGEKWEANRLHDVASRTLDGLTAYIL
ncbi:hypothetical protein KEM52_001829 [Ascosphaera acerosa]|nr:hypothetical protein KEM52_001829 [Ascosphaera acerosa]